MSDPGGRPVLVVEDNQSQLDTIVFTLADHGIDAAHGTPVLTARSGAEALAIVEREAERLAVVLSDLKMPGKPDGLGLLTAAVKLAPRARRILVTAYAGELSLTEAVNAGRIDALLEKGYGDDALVMAVRDALDAYDALAAVIEENRRLRGGGDAARVLAGIVGASAAMRELKEEVARVARVDHHVLILGETGTGKELVARAVHDLSRRRDQPYLAVNCAAVPETLLEGEFFGTRRGAYSGSVDRRGLIEAAAGGTLLLDEVGKAPVVIQSKLLRFLGSGRFMPVGAREEVSADVRVVATANEDLEAAMESGTFLKDLYYRLRGTQLRIPRLADRPDDVAPLARHFLDRFNRDYARAVLGFDEDAMAAMRTHAWPGNVRELEETIRDAVVRRAEDGAFLTARDLALDGQSGAAPAGAALDPSLVAAVEARLAAGEDLGEIRLHVERIALERALADAGWVIETASKRLGVSRPWVYDRLERFALSRPGSGEDDDGPST